MSASTFKNKMLTSEHNNNPTDILYKILRPRLTKKIHHHLKVLFQIRSLSYKFFVLVNCVLKYARNIRMVAKHKSRYPIC